MPVFEMPLDELRRYRGRNPRPADFDAYWAAALGELASIDGNVALHHLGRLGGCHLSSSCEPACVAEGSSALRRPARRSLATARTPPTSGPSRMRSTSDSSRGGRGSMRAGANNAIRELGGLFGVGVLALEEFQNAWHELFVVLEDAAVSGVLVERQLGIR